MLPPPGAIAAGGLYTATEFDVTGARRAAAVAGRDGPRGGPRRPPQRRRRAADVGGHPGLPRPLRLRLRHRLRVGAGRRVPDEPPGSQIRGVTRLRAAQARRPAEYTVHPYRPVIDRRQGPRRHRAAGPGGGAAADARLPAAGRPGVRRTRPRPRLRCRRLPCAARQAPGRHPLPEAAAVGGRGERDGGRDRVDDAVDAHPWLPRATCDASCVRAGGAPTGSRPCVARARRACGPRCALLLLPALPLLAIPMPGRSHIQRGYCRLMLRCLGVRITVSGRPDSQPARRARGQRPRVLGRHLRDRRGACRARSSPSAELISWPGLGIAGAR